MRTTTQTFKRIMASGGARKYLVNIDLTLADTTVLHLTEADIWDNTFKIETASSGTSSFDIGSAVIGKCSFSINNFDERFNQYDFFNASAVVWVKLVGDTQYYRMGFYTVDEPVYASSLITLELLDNMWKFDIPLSAVTLSYPITIRNAFVAICQYCGVTLGTQTFHGDSFTIEAAPEKDMNCREFLQYMAMIGCNFLTISDTGALLVKWYNTSAIPSGTDIDGGTFDTNTTPYSDGANLNGGTFAFNDGDTADGGTFTDNSDCVWFTRNMQATFGTDVITITGVKFTINDTAYTIGTAGYMLELENPIVNANNVNTVLNLIWDVLNGFSLRTYNITTISDLSAEVGDCCILKDYKGNFFYSWITLNSFGFSNHVVQCNAVTPQRQLAKRYSKTVAAAVAESRIATEQFISDYDVAVQLMNDLAVNAMGAYQNYEDLQTGGRVYYLSNMPITKVGNTCSFQSGSTVFKRTGDGLYVSTNGGQTWQNGYNAQTGQLIVNVLNAIGISADWIKTGTLDADLITAGRIRDRYNYNYWDLDTGDFRLAALPAGQSISDPDANHSEAYVPTNSNLPASNWTTDEQKKQHVGETFYNTSSKKTYIYKASSGNAVVHFNSQCATEGNNYDYVDIYIPDGSSYKKVRLQGNTSAFGAKNIPVASEFWLHWHTDVSQHNYYGWKIDSIDSSGGDTVSWTSASLPSATWTNINYPGSTLPESEHNPYSDNVDNYYHFTITSSGTYEWVEATLEDYVDAKASKQSEVSLTQEEVYNILTNNGQTQGIFLNSSDNKLYLNGQFFTANAIRVGGSNYSQRPYIEVKDINDDPAVKLDVTGITAVAGTFGKLRIFTNSSNVTYLKYVSEGSRYYANESWSAGKITDYNSVVRFIVNPYREGWQENGRIYFDFYMNVTSSHASETQVNVTVYRYSGSTRSIFHRAYVKADGSGTGMDEEVIIDPDTGTSTTRHILDCTFSSSFGANEGELYYVVCTLQKRNATYMRNTTATLVADDGGLGSAFVVREGNDHRAVCTGRFQGEFTGEATLDVLKMDYLICDGSELTFYSDSFGGVATSYDGIRVWSGTSSKPDYGDSNTKLELFSQEIYLYEGSSNPVTPQWSASDERVKEDIEDLDNELSKNFIDGSQPKRFKFKEVEGHHYGMIAQQARVLLDSLGETDSKLEQSIGSPNKEIPDQRNINYFEYIPHLINYVKDLRAEIDGLKAEIKALKGE